MSTHKKENPSAATDGLLTTTTPSSDLKETKMSDFNGSTDAPQISLPEAEKFLELLDGLDTTYTFQTIPNQVSGRSANTLHGCIDDLWDQLTAANQQGDGAFVTVNETDGQGRKASNIIRVRAIFVDKDDGRLHELRNLPLPPHMIIESSPGNGHAYWLIEHCPLDGFKDAQKMLATALGGDPAVCDPPRVMRLPGLLHTKGSPFLTRIVQINDLPKYTLDQLYESYGNEYSDEPVKKPLGKKASLSIGYPDGQRTRALTEIIGALIAKGLPDEQILAPLIKWNEKNQPPLPLEKLTATLGDIRRCESRKKSAVDALIDEMNTLCAVTLLGAKCVVVVDEGNDAVFMSPQDFERYFSNKKLPDGRSLPKAWLEHPRRRTYKGITFDPAGAPPHLYNLFKGFAFDGKKGDCRKFLKHLLEVVCSQDQQLYEYVLDWMADIIQNPRKLTGVALILMGGQGTGKGVFAEYFGKLFGSHFQHVSNPEHLVGRFNGNLSSSLLVFADEAFWAGDKAKLGALKTLITEPRRMIEMKHKDAAEVDNYVRLIVASNEDWVVPAEADDRRFCVLKVSDARKGDTAYFQNIINERDSGGAEALMHFLQHRDLSGKDLRKIPVTGALVDQKLKTLPSHQKWLYNMLSIGELDGRDFGCGCFPKTRLYNSYEEFCNRQRLRSIVDNSTFFKSLRSILSLSDSRLSTDAGKIRHITFPPLDESRRSFEAWIGGSLDWS